MGREDGEETQGDPPPLHKCIRREFCNCQYPSTGISVPVRLVLRFIRAYVKARSLLTVRAQRATCRPLHADQRQRERRVSKSYHAYVCGPISLSIRGMREARYIFNNFLRNIRRRLSKCESAPANLHAFISRQFVSLSLVSLPLSLLYVYIIYFHTDIRFFFFPGKSIAYQHDNSMNRSLVDVDRI